MSTCALTDKATNNGLKIQNGYLMLHIVILFSHLISETLILKVKYHF